ncbi:MAG: hypothetical protein EXR72_14620 [Myxococcales bacterium]|nr:hypothetical protein [Myxococcales bacterium]
MGRPAALAVARGARRRVRGRHRIDGRRTEPHPAGSDRPPDGSRVPARPRRVTRAAGTAGPDRAGRARPLRTATRADRRRTHRPRGAGAVRRGLLRARRRPRAQLVPLRRDAARLDLRPRLCALAPPGQRRRLQRRAAGGAGSGRRDRRGLRRRRIEQAPGLRARLGRHDHAARGDPLAPRSLAPGAGRRVGADRRREPAPLPHFLGRHGRDPARRVPLPPPPAAADAVGYPAARLPRQRLPAHRDWLRRGLLADPPVLLSVAALGPAPPPSPAAASDDANARSVTCGPGPRPHRGPPRRRADRSPRAVRLAASPGRVRCTAASPGRGLAGDHFIDLPARLSKALVVAACPDCGVDCPDGAAACPGCKKGLGRTLHAEQADGTPSLARTLDIAAGLAATMAAMHEAKVVHKDLRPRNVYLVKRKGQEDVVKLLNPGKSAPEGTPPDYAAPEESAGAPADARSNLHAFGVILHELATGTRPVAGASPSKTARARGVTQAIPRPLEELIVHCLQKFPAERPRSMREVDDRLSGIRVAFRAGVATPTSAAEAAGSPMKWVAIVGVPLVLVGLSYFAWRAMSAPDPPRVVPAVISVDAAVAAPRPPDLGAPPDAAHPPDLAAPKAAVKAKPSRPYRPKPPPAAPAQPAAVDPFAPKVR